MIAALFEFGSGLYQILQFVGMAGMAGMAGMDAVHKSCHFSLACHYQLTNAPLQEPVQRPSANEAHEIHQWEHGDLAGDVR